MNLRLIRALRRGGVTAKLTKQGWGVWRRPDRRSRRIGSFTGAEIDVLRLYDCLIWAAPSSNQVLSWRSPNAESMACVEDLIAANKDPSRERACLDHLILSHRDVSARWRLAQTARGFRRDAMMPESKQSDSRQRTVPIAAAVSKLDYQFLCELALMRLSKTELAASHKMRPMAVAARSSELLNRIAHFYN